MINEETPITACRLDRDGLNRQRDRYARVGAHAEAIVRDERALVVRFGPQLDPQLLQVTIAVERECCPFFSFDYSEANRLLTVRAPTPEHTAPLDALAFALGRDRIASDR
jgi:hypothetical protein